MENSPNNEEEKKWCKDHSSMKICKNCPAYKGMFSSPEVLIWEEEFFKHDWCCFVSHCNEDNKYIVDFIRSVEEKAYERGKQEKNKELIQQFHEQEKFAFHVLTSEKYIILNESSINDLLNGKKIAAPIRSAGFPTIREDKPTIDEFNENTMIIKKDHA